MGKIIWTELAREDLQQIHDYIAKNSPIYARKYLTKLISKTFLLRNHPKMGRIVPEFNDEFIRELIDGNYRIIYKISKESVGIARVYHSARELKPI